MTKDPIIWEKWQATEWETVLTNYTSDRGYYLERLRTKNTDP